MSYTLGCGEGTFPAKYLGFPLGAMYSSKSIWGPMFERFTKNLAGWKGNYLSGVGGWSSLRACCPISPFMYTLVFHSKEW